MTDVNTPAVRALLLARSLYNKLRKQDTYSAEETRRWRAYESAWFTYRRSLIVKNLADGRLTGDF